MQPYNRLKEALLASHQLTDFQRVELLLAVEPLSSRKPSELLADMLADTSGSPMLQLRCGLKYCKGSAKLPNCKYVMFRYHEGTRSRGPRSQKKESLPPDQINPGITETLHNLYFYSLSISLILSLLVSKFL